MIIDIDPQPNENINIFKKKQYLNISLLQTRTPHIAKNKLSDKFNRRDMSFYNLYVKKEKGEELAKLNEMQFPLEIGA